MEHLAEQNQNSTYTGPGPAEMLGSLHSTRGALCGRLLDVTHQGQVKLYNEEYNDALNSGLSKADAQNWALDMSNMRSFHDQ